jgi:conjugative transfer region protein TrbK
MSARSRLDRLSVVAGVAVLVLVVAACAIKLRGDEDQLSALPSAQEVNPLAAELARCRTVTSEQKDALAECRRIWAEQRRQFLGQSKTPTPTGLPNDNAPNIRFPAPGPRKDESRLPQGWPSISLSESE